MSQPAAIPFHAVSRVYDWPGVPDQRMLVAAERLPAGTVLKDEIVENSSPPRTYSSFVNDADFFYPSTFDDYNSVLAAFTRYLQTQPTNNNLERITPAEQEEQLYRVTRTIEKGQPITERYGIIEWVSYLYFELASGGKVLSGATHYNVARMPMERRGAAAQMLLQIQKELRPRFEHHYPIDFRYGPATLLMVHRCKPAAESGGSH